MNTEDPEWLSAFTELVAAGFTGPHSSAWDVEPSAIELVLRTEAGDRRLTIRCSGVARFSLQGVGGQPIQVLGLTLEDWTERGLQDVRWRLHDVEDARIDVLCREVDLQVDAWWSALPWCMQRVARSTPERSARTWTPEGGAAIALPGPGGDAMKGPLTAGSEP